MIDGRAGRAEHQRIRRLVEAQHVDDRIFPIRWRNGQRAVFDVEMLLLLGLGR